MNESRQPLLNLNGTVCRTRANHPPTVGYIPSRTVMFERIYRRGQPVHPPPGTFHPDA